MEEKDNSIKKISINQLAVKTACLHSLRYLNDDTLGIFIGSCEKDKIIIDDAYPLFHSRITEPTIQIAFDIIQGLLTEGKQIVGIYESIIRLENENNLHSEIAGKILETINEMNQLNPIFIEEPEVEEDDNQNEDDKDQEKEEAQAKIDFQVFFNVISDRFHQIYQFLKKGSASFNLKLINSALEEQIDLDVIYSEFKKGTHRQIIDFDNHFEDPSLDFTNPQLKV